MPHEGNYGRWERHVDRYDPYGYQDKVDERLALRHLNTRIQAANAQQRDMDHRAKLDKWEQAEQERKAERDELGITEYQQQLAKRGLAKSKIQHGLGEELEISGFVDPETRLMLQELAEQGLMREGKFNSSKQNRAALRSMYDKHLSEKKESQAKADRAAEIASARGHEKELKKMDLDAVAADRAARDATEEKRYNRDAEIRALQVQAEKDRIAKAKADQERAEAERLGLADRLPVEDIGRFRAGAQAGDMEQYAALKRLLQARPDLAQRLGVNAESARPTADKVLGHPAIAQRLEKLRAMKLDGAAPQEVKSIVDQLWRLAGESEFGPAVMEEVKGIISGQLGKEWWLDENERTISSYANDWWK